MPIFELIQEMMFVNMCVKFRDNRLRNEICRTVTPFEHVRTNVRTYVRADPYIPVVLKLFGSHYPSAML